MSQTTASSQEATPEQTPPGEFRTPEKEQADKGDFVPSAHDIPLEEINPINAHIYSQNKWREYFERLRKEDPIHFNRIKTAGRYWSITRYEDIKAIDVDWENFSSAHGITLGFDLSAGEPEGMIQTNNPFISQDPPEHAPQRKTVSGVVAPTNLRNLEPLIRERTCQVLDSLPEHETFDWVDTVSIELTTLMLATLFDFPLEDRRKLTRWSDIVFAIPQPGGVVESMTQKREELMECVGYFSGLWEERRKNPGDDLVSMLVHGEATKDTSPLEHLGNLLLLIVGGNDTTRNSMSGSVYALNKFPEQYEKLIASPKLIPQMVAELIRWQTPLSYMRRTAKRDIEIRGKQIRKNDQILMWYLSGNRDESVFENADALDIERPNARQHLSFGFGIHRCMGNRLAELQLRVLWEEILKRFEKIEIQAEPEYTFSSFVHGYTSLPVKVSRKWSGEPSAFLGKEHLMGDGDLSPPAGFTEHFRKSKFTDPWEPLYSKVRDDQIHLGVYLRDVHCNSRGIVHGGFLSSIADNAMGLSCGQVLRSQEREFTGLVTVSLATDFAGSAKVGDWLQTEISVVKAGGSLCFANCLIYSGDELVARSNACFKVLS